MKILMKHTWNGGVMNIQLPSEWPHTFPRFLVDTAAKYRYFHNGITLTILVVKIGCCRQYETVAT